MRLKLGSHSIYDSRRTLAIGFVVAAVLLVGIFLYVSNRLVKDLAAQERDRMETWAGATKALASAETDQDLSFYLDIIERNHNVPALLTDAEGNILLHRNFRLPEEVDSQKPYEISEANMRYLESKLEALERSDHKIEINNDDNTPQYVVYYEDSIVLRNLGFFPYVQLSVLLIFIVIVYFALTSIKRAEQNRVWVGLSKETAHQLGTPISSLMAWSQLLEGMVSDKTVVKEIDKDVRRLSVIADRFSKIGSRPEMELEFLNEAVDSSMEYMRGRISKRVVLNVVSDAQTNCGVMLCPSLFEWVMENLTKNAVDAMQGEGRITITVTSDATRGIIDVADTGKGIAHKNFKQVFNPGYTTKKRGWGLGLALVKRIIEEYHGGKIYVKESVIGQGTTFRIELPRGEQTNKKS